MEPAVVAGPVYWMTIHTWDWCHGSDSLLDTDKLCKFSYLNVFGFACFIVYAWFALVCFSDCKLELRINNFNSSAWNSSDIDDQNNNTCIDLSSLTGRLVQYLISLP